MVYARHLRVGGDLNSRLTRSCLSGGGRIKTQGTGRSEEEVDEQVALAVVKALSRFFRLAVNGARC
jgi:hypothetical protein